MILEMIQVQKVSDAWNQIQFKDIKTNTYLASTVVQASE